MGRRPRYEPSRFEAQRYRGENVDFWVPRFAQAASIGRDEVIVDLGCGTGGFTSALGVTAFGVEIDPALAGHGRRVHPGLRVAVADVAAMPLRDDAADVALASLIFHQVDRRSVASEAARVLRRGGRLVVRTVAPDDAAQWVPHRWFPTVVAAQRQRMPEIELLCAELSRVGLDVVDVTVVEQERSIVAADAEVTVEHEVLSRYDLSEVEVADGLARLRAADGERYVRRHTLIVARRT